MPINTISTASKYTDALDKRFVQKAVTGFMNDNVFAAKFVGAKTVLIPSIDFVGLANYDRDNGFSRGAMTVSHEPHTLLMDRARSLQIDREDLDETGIAALAGKFLGEYVRTKVVPECDAYILSKFRKIANEKSHTQIYDDTSVFKDLIEQINNVNSVAGYDEEVVAFVDSVMFGALMNSSEFNKQVIISEFKQGDLNLKVKSINGATIIPVPSERMKTEYIFETGEEVTAGGFTPKETAKQIHAIVLPKSAGHVVRKTEQLRIFEPHQNLDADAYKFDYRIYYDAFVKKSQLDTVFTLEEQ